MATSLDTSVVIGRCAERFCELGLTVRQSNDFNAVEALTQGIGKPYLTPQLSPSWQEFTKDHAFWPIAEDHKRSPTAMIGVRHDQLGGEALSSYWLRQLTRMHGEQKILSSTRGIFHQPPARFPATWFILAISL